MTSSTSGRRGEHVTAGNREPGLRSDSAFDQHRSSRYTRRLTVAPLSLVTRFAVLSISTIMLRVIDCVFIRCGPKCDPAHSMGNRVQSLVAVNVHDRRFCSWASSSSPSFSVSFTNPWTGEKGIMRCMYSFAAVGRKAQEVGERV
jgi:hypothetical protein